MYRFVVMAPNAWDGPYMNRQQIFSRIARRHAVVYSNGAAELGQGRPRPSVPQDGAGTVLVEVPSRWFATVRQIPAWNRLVVARSAARLRRMVEVRRGGPLIAYLFHAKFLDYVRPLQPDLLVYHAYDLFSRYKGWSAKSERRQRELLERADLVIASSTEIGLALGRLCERPIHVVPNGVDYNAFATGDLAEPADVAPIPRPRVGYAGALSRKVDFRLLCELAHRQPSWQFVLTGDQRALDTVSRHQFDEAASQPNVHVLGSRPYSEVPAFVRAMDVNIMCYRLADDLWVHAGYPLKLHEYLASGQPAVSADLASVREFRDVVAIARDIDEWESAIESALRHSGPGDASARQAVARENTWDARVAHIEALLDEAMEVVRRK